MNHMTSVSCLEREVVVVFDPVWVCAQCAILICNNKQSGVATWHTGQCDVCKETKVVTEPRDFGGLRSDAIKIWKEFKSNKK